jgi:hypothetical protein
MRIILIDQYSGYIYGDSADYEGGLFTLDDARQLYPDMDPHSAHDFALAYADALDRHIGGERRRYEWAHDSDGQSGYIAYTTGDDIVGVIHDGQSRQEIDAVERDCPRISGKIIWKTQDGPR